MKLFEISKLLILNEILNTKIAVDSWHKDGEKDIGVMHIDNDAYHVILEPVSYNEIPDHPLIVVNVAFEKLVNNQSTQEMTGDNKSASKVIGAITHALHDRLQQYHCDVIIFVAKDNVAKRMRVYNYVASHFGAGFSRRRENIKLNSAGAVATMLIGNHIAPEIVDQLEQIIIQSNKP